MSKTAYYILFLLLLLASLGDLLVPVLIGTKFPGYSHLTHTISTLGTDNSPVQKYLCLNLVIVGIFFLIFTAGQHILFTSKIWAHNWYTAGIIIFAIGCILAGIFPEDIQGTEETMSGKIHGIASGIGFLFLILTPLLAVWIKEFSHFKTVNIVLFILGLLTFVLFILSENKTAGFLKYTGLFQRLNIIILYGALIINFLKMKDTF